MKRVTFEMRHNAMRNHNGYRVCPPMTNLFWRAEDGLIVLRKNLNTDDYEYIIL